MSRFMSPGINPNIPDQSVLEMLSTFFNQRNQSPVPRMGSRPRAGAYGQIGGGGGFSPGVNASVGAGGVGLGVGANFQGDGFNIGGNVDVGGLLNMIGQDKFKRNAMESAWDTGWDPGMPSQTLAEEVTAGSSLIEPATSIFASEGASALASEGASALATEGATALAEEELLNIILGMVPML